MNRLKNHAEALMLAAETGSDKLKELLAAGMNPERLKQILDRREMAAGYVVAAVSNSDTCRVKEQLFVDDPAGIVAGLTAFIKLTGARGGRIITLADVDAPAYEELAAKAGISLTIAREEMVIRTEHREDIHVRPDELRAAAMALTGDKAGILLAVNDGGLFEVDPLANVWETVENQAGDLSSCKAFLVDHAFFTPEAFRNMKAEDLPDRSGVITVLDQSTCLVDRAYRELMILREKSCGRCTFCREGLIQLAGRIDQVRGKRAKGAGMDLAQEIAEAMCLSGHCELGDDAALPVLSLIRNFPDELDAHIRRGECPAGVCQAYCSYYIDPSACSGKGSCAAVCPAGAIGTKTGYTSVIDVFACTGCGTCLAACPDGAVHVTWKKPPRNTDTPQRLKRTAAARPETASASEEETEKKPAAERSGRRKRAFAKPVRK